MERAIRNTELNWQILKGKLSLQEIFALYRMDAPHSIEEDDSFAYFVLFSVKLQSYKELTIAGKIDATLPFHIRTGDYLKSDVRTFDTVWQNGFQWRVSQDGTLQKMFAL